VPLLVLSHREAPAALTAEAAAGPVPKAAPTACSGPAPGQKQHLRQMVQGMRTLASSGPVPRQTPHPQREVLEMTTTSSSVLARRQTPRPRQMVLETTTLASSGRARRQTPPPRQMALATTTLSVWERVPPRRPHPRPALKLAMPQKPLAQTAPVVQWRPGRRRQLLRLPLDRPRPLAMEEPPATPQQPLELELVLVLALPAVVGARWPLSAWALAVQLLLALDLHPALARGQALAPQRPLQPQPRMGYEAAAEVAPAMAPQLALRPALALALQPVLAMVLVLPMAPVLALQPALAKALVLTMAMAPQVVLLLTLALALRPALALAHPSMPEGLVALRQPALGQMLGPQPSVPRQAVPQMSAAVLVQTLLAAAAQLQKLAELVVRQAPAQALAPRLVLALAPRLVAPRLPVEEGVPAPPMSAPRLQEHRAEEEVLVLHPRPRKGPELMLKLALELRLALALVLLPRAPAESNLEMLMPVRWNQQPPMRPESYPQSGQRSVPELRGLAQQAALVPPGQQPQLVLNLLLVLQLLPALQSMLAQPVLALQAPRTMLPAVLGLPLLLLPSALLQQGQALPSSAMLLARAEAASTPLESKAARPPSRAPGAPALRVPVQTAQMSQPPVLLVQRLPARLVLPRVLPRLLLPVPGLLGLQLQAPASAHAAPRTWVQGTRSSQQPGPATVPTSWALAVA